MVIFDDTREAWGATPPVALTQISPALRTEFVTHWNGPEIPFYTDHARCLATVKSIQNYHMGTRGWDDIGYNGLVCHHGRSIEGRGIDVQGAHAYAHNAIGYGFMLMMGMTEGKPPQVATPVMHDRLRDVMLECVSRSGHTLNLLGHMDVSSTDCPGEDNEAWVKAGMPRQTEEEETMTEETAKALVAAIDSNTEAVKSVVAQQTTLTEQQRLLMEFLQTNLVQGLTGIAEAVTALGPSFTEDVDRIVERVGAGQAASIQQGITDALGGVSVVVKFPTSEGN